MAKLSSRDILDVMRNFKLATDDNIPRHIEAIKETNPRSMNTLFSYRFMGQPFYLLFDDTAEDDANYVMKQILPESGTLEGKLITNPKDDILTYAMPFRGKDCYLFKVVSEKKRIDSELARLYPDKSRATWQKYIKSGYVSLNGKVILSTRQEVTDADTITFDIPDAPDYNSHELPIIYKDDNVIVINKPTGVLSHSKGVLNEEFTAADFFKRYTTFNADTNRPGIVHRLDRDTSGVMIGARNPETATLLSKQFADRKTKKTYLAIVVGHPKLDKANVDLPIGRNPSAPSTFRVDPNGKSAITKYEVLASNDKYSLVKLMPQTGRTHQLRVHMKYLNTPILGDRVYGKTDERLYLHAYSLEITIPSGNRQIFYAPMPEEFKKYFPDIKI
jgi:23S rRNA pseudouridine1911/1915/1917 synthase